MEGMQRACGIRTVCMRCMGVYGSSRYIDSEYNKDEIPECMYRLCNM